MQAFRFLKITHIFAGMGMKPNADGLRSAARQEAVIQGQDVYTTGLMDLLNSTNPEISSADQARPSSATAPGCRP